ncbi:DUF4260 domain-containing protein [Fulvivirga sediminis]|uniref:DUF4260 domain-containing protein n=1 Tax=Fulvivirga sediminis TaxID=2803949 RepID=A0A937JZK6_9BACT|nr:DUF4260 domain-containing protein [Fulvivirga sediminis]MBL3654507.1 DUF4260 domain-containing protein [Fulvivirga sediminis]
MKTTLKLEEAAVFGLCMVLFAQLDIAWWWFPLLLFVPDIGMLGYAVNTKIGAITYNICHHRLVAVLMAIVSFSIGSQTGLLIAIIIFAHISFDRMLGYGLKYTDSFKHTHLGTMGKK